MIWLKDIVPEMYGNIQTKDDNDQRSKVNFRVEYGITSCIRKVILNN